MNKILKAVKDPKYALHVLSRKLQVSIRQKSFAHAEEYRSDSENGYYASSIMQALKDQSSFDNFKRNYDYRKILEHVSEEQGAQYLKVLQSRNDGVLEAGLSSVLLSDNVGNPIKFKYQGFNYKLSPTTLRYLKVTSDLKILFGENLGNVAEIGCGYGGQALVNDQLLNVTFAHLFDLPFVNMLIDRYLNTQLLRGAYRTTVINNTLPQDYDLVISNYAFSELPKMLQLAYIKKVIARSKHGYLTMNSGTGSSRSTGKLTLDELKGLLPKFSLIEEEPQTAAHNYIIVWGCKQESLQSNFKINRLIAN
jgi:putative sugar O-methyltransferase